MHYKTFFGLLLAAQALASPSYEFEEPSVPSLASSSLPPPYYDIPVSAITVIANVIPSTWVEEMMDDPAARQSMADAIEWGTYPPWYYELPATIRPYASKVAVEELYYLNQGPPTVVPSISTHITATGWWTVSPSSVVYTTTPPRSSSTPLQMSSIPLQTSSSTSSSTLSGTGTASSTTAGAPAATAGAATLAGAGAAALLGVALAL